MDTNTIEPIIYRSLDDIREQKDAILAQINDDDNKIKALWDRLFAPSNNIPTTPSKRLRRIFNLGVGIFDGALLGWKLYKKFNCGNILSRL